MVYQPTLGRCSSEIREYEYGIDGHLDRDDGQADVVDSRHHPSYISY